MSQVPEQWIVMFAKAPVPGRVKTRLAVHLGNERAAMCHAAFIEDMFEVMQQVQRHASSLAHTRSKASTSPTVRLCLAVAGDDDHPAFDALKAAGVHVMIQGEGDLGAKLTDISARCFAQGCKQLIITGSDSPTLLPRMYEQAFEHLAKADATVVFGPSFDGGYYLVGMNQHTPTAFENIPWSQSDTLAVTLKRLEQLPACLCVLLEFWYDVDTLSDLQFLNSHLRHLRQHSSLSNLCVRTYALLLEWDCADLWNSVTS